MSENKKNIVLF